MSEGGMSEGGVSQSGRRAGHGPAKAKVNAVCSSQPPTLALSKKRARSPVPDMRLLSVALAAALALGAATAVDESPKPAPGPTPLACASAPPPARDTTLCSASGAIVVNDRKRYSLTVPAGVGSLTVRLTPSGERTGDADLEVVPPSDASAEPKSSREVRSETRKKLCISFQNRPPFAPARPATASRRPAPFPQPPRSSLEE